MRHHADKWIATTKRLSMLIMSRSTAVSSFEMTLMDAPVRSTCREFTLHFRYRCPSMFMNVLRTHAQVRRNETSAPAHTNDAPSTYRHAMQLQSNASRMQKESEANNEARQQKEKLRTHAPISHKLSRSSSTVLGEPDAKADGTNLHWYQTREHHTSQEISEITLKIS